MRVRKLTDKEYYDKYYEPPENENEMTDEEIAEEVQNQNDGAWNDYCDSKYEKYRKRCDNSISTNNNW